MHEEVEPRGVHIIAVIILAPTHCHSTVRNNMEYQYMCQTSTKNEF